MARPDGDQRGLRARPRAWPVRGLSGRLVERERLCRGDPRAPRAHQFLRVPRLPYQSPRYLQAHRRRAAASARCPRVPRQGTEGEHTHRGLHRRGQRAGGAGDDPGRRREQPPRDCAGGRTVLAHPASGLGEDARRASPDGGRAPRPHPGVASAGWLGRRPARRSFGAARERTRFAAEPPGRTPLARLSQAAAAPVPGRRRAPSGVRGARAARRRHGAREDRAGDRGVRVAARAARHRVRAGGGARVPQDRMGGADRDVLRLPDHRGARQPRGSPVRLGATDLLHDLQLRAGGGGPAGAPCRTAPRCRDPGRSAAHQELADQDRERGEEARQPLRLRPHRHAAREPDRRGLLDRPVPGPRSSRPPVPIQPRVLRAGRARSADRVSQSRQAGRTGLLGHAPAAQGGTWRASFPAAPRRPSSSP